MKVAFVSNFYNHHQKPLADALYSMLGEDYFFIETMPMRQERLNMGWGGEEKPPYVLQNYLDEASAEKCREIVDTADVVILGSAPYSLIAGRLKEGRLTFKYSERLYKKGCPYHKLPWHFYLNTKKYRRYKNFYILCASAYTALDFAKTFTFWGKAYKWGYFTQVKRYDDVGRLIEEKRPASILWVARLIGLKHPEHAVEVARRLKADGYDFQLSLIGNGELEEDTRALIDRYELADRVKILGAMKPEQVRAHMEQSEIFLFTSDRNEGWGAVLNESMNSACAVVASHAIGSVPFLIKDGENGMIYQDGNLDELYRKVKALMDDPRERKRIAQNAYLTMAEEWSPEKAARKILQLSEMMLGGACKPCPFNSGVLSKAKIIRDNWFK